MSKRYLELKKDNYLGIITFTSSGKRMIEIIADNEDNAYAAARKYASRYCKRLGDSYVHLTVVRIPDCITVVD